MVVLMTTQILELRVHRADQHQDAAVHDQDRYFNPLHHEPSAARWAS